MDESNQDQISEGINFNQGTVFEGQQDEVSKRTSKVGSPTHLKDLFKNGKDGKENEMMNMKRDSNFLSYSEDKKLISDPEIKKGGLEDHLHQASFRKSQNDIGQFDFEILNYEYKDRMPNEFKLIHDMLKKTCESMSQTDPLLQNDAAARDQQILKNYYMDIEVRAKTLETWLIEQDIIEPKDYESMKINPETVMHSPGVSQIEFGAQGEDEEQEETAVTQKTYQFVNNCQILRDFLIDNNSHNMDKQSEEISACFKYLMKIQFRILMFMPFKNLNSYNQIIQKEKQEMRQTEKLSKKKGKQQLEIHKQKEKQRKVEKRSLIEGFHSTDLKLISKCFNEMQKLNIMLGEEDHEMSQFVVTDHEQVDFSDDNLIGSSIECQLPEKLNHFLAIDPQRNNMVLSPRSDQKCYFEFINCEDTIIGMESAFFIKVIRKYETFSQENLKQDAYLTVTNNAEGQLLVTLEKNPSLKSYWTIQQIDPHNPKIVKIKHVLWPKGRQQQDQKLQEHLIQAIESTYLDINGDNLTVRELGQTKWVIHQTIDSRVQKLEEQIQYFKADASSFSKQMDIDDIMDQLKSATFDKEQYNELYKPIKMYQAPLLREYEDKQYIEEGIRYETPFPSFAGVMRDKNGNMDLCSFNTLESGSEQIYQVKSILSDKSIVPDHDINVQCKMSMGQITHYGRKSNRVYVYSQFQPYLYMYEDDLKYVDFALMPNSSAIKGKNWYQQMQYARFNETPGTLCTQHDLENLQREQFTFSEDTFIACFGQNEATNDRQWVNIQSQIEDNEKNIMSGRTHNAKIQGKSLHLDILPKDQEQFNDNLKGVLIKHKSLQGIYQFDGCIHSVREINESCLLITFGSITEDDLGKNKKLMLWNLERKPEEQNIRVIMSKNRSQFQKESAFSKFEQKRQKEMTQTNLLAMRPHDKYSDRDIVVDYQKGLFYTLGENCIYKFRLQKSNTMFEKIDKVDLSSRPVGLRLTIDNKFAYVICQNIDEEDNKDNYLLHIINLDYMTLISTIQLEEKCTDFALSNDRRIMVTTHKTNWKIWKENKQTKDYYEIFEAECPSEEPFQAEIDDNDIYISFFKKHSRETTFKLYKFEGRNLEKEFITSQKVKAFKIYNNDTVYLATDRKIEKLTLTFDGIEKSNMLLNRHENMVVNLFDILPQRTYYIEKSTLKQSFTKRSSALKGDLALRSSKKKLGYEMKHDLTDKEIRFITIYDDGQGRLTDSDLLAVWDEYFNLQYILKLRDNINKVVVVDHEIISVQNLRNHLFVIYQLPSQLEVERQKELHTQNLNAGQIQDHQQVSLSVPIIEALPLDEEKEENKISFVNNEQQEPQQIQEEQDDQLTKFKVVKVFSDPEDSYYWPIEQDQRDSNSLVNGNAASFFIFKYEYTTIDLEEDEKEKPEKKAKDKDKNKDKNLDDLDIEYDEFNEDKFDLIKQHYICEVKVQKNEKGYQRTEELIHLRIDNVAQIQRAVLHNEQVHLKKPDPNYECKSYLAVLSGVNRVKEEDLISNTLFIWDITHRKIERCPEEVEEITEINKQNNEIYSKDLPTIVWDDDEGFVLKKMLPFGNTQVTNLGFVQINNEKLLIEEQSESDNDLSDDDGKSSSSSSDDDQGNEEDSDDEFINQTSINQILVWFITKEEDANFYVFKVYSIEDEKVIHEQEITNSQSIKNVFFDQKNKYIYLVDDHGLIMSNLLWQKQDMQKSLSNFINAIDLQKVDSHAAFQEIMDQFMSYPQMQNMIHFYAITNQEDQMTDMMEQPGDPVVYCSDIDGRTPLKVAYDLNNENVLSSLLKAFEIDEDREKDNGLFLNFQDFLILLDDSSPMVNRPLENLFQESEFLDKDDNMYRGELKFGWYDTYISGFFSDSYKNQKIFFETKSKYLIFEDDPSLFRGQLPDSKIPNGVKKALLKEDPEELHKVEFKTLSFDCSLEPGSKFSEIMLIKMSSSPNKDLFRTNCKEILDYKWNQLKGQVYKYNFCMLTYVLFIAFIQIVGSQLKDIRYTINLIAFVATLIVAVPELYQNILSLYKIIKYKRIMFEDLQNFYEFFGYLCQMIYLAITIFKAGPNGEVVLEQSAFVLNIISCLLIFTRGFFLLKIFGPLRSLIRMIKEVISFLLPFTLLLVASALFFSVEMQIMLKKHFNLKQHDNDLPSYIDVFKDQLIGIPSGGEYSEDIVDVANMENWSLYFLSMYINYIILMNLLIAIIGEKFGIVLEQSIPLDCIERANFILEIEEFKSIWRHAAKLCSCGKEKKREETERFYIHYAQYLKDEDEEDPEAIELEGRLRMMTSKLNKTQANFRKRTFDLSRSNLELQEQLANLYFKNEQTKKIKELQDEAIFDLDKLLAMNEHTGQAKSPQKLDKIDSLDKLALEIDN